VGFGASVGNACAGTVPEFPPRREPWIFTANPIQRLGNG
jgi:hypothetical protein